MILLMTSLALAPAFHSQAAAQPSDTVVLIYNGRPMELSALGVTKVFLKDGTIKINCVIVEMHAGWIVYKKDRTLHDLAIDKIKRIESPKEMVSVYFDEKHHPHIKPLDY